MVFFIFIIITIIISSSSSSSSSISSSSSSSIRPNKKKKVFPVTGLKILDRVGTHFFLEKYKFMRFESHFAFQSA